jgi:hypothetical protein
MIEREDRDHLAFAADRGRVFVHLQRQGLLFLHSAFLKQGKAHAGLILARQQQYSVGEQMRRLLKLIASRSAEEMRDQVEFLSTWN